MLSGFSYNIDKEKLIQFYKDNYFSEVARIPDENQPMVRL